MLMDGYAVGSVNNHLSTIKTYAKLATMAGIISTQEHAMIRMVSGYSHKEGQRVDEQREAADIETRRGDKKSDFMALSMYQEGEPVTRSEKSASIVCLELPKTKKLSIVKEEGLNRVRNYLGLPKNYTGQDIPENI